MSGEPRTGHRLALSGPIDATTLAARAAALEERFSVVPVDPHAADQAQSLELSGWLGPDPPADLDAVRDIAAWHPAGPAPAPGEAAVLFSSGTTGAPHPVHLSHDMVAHHADASRRRLDHDGASVWGLALPAHRMGGFNVIDRAVRDDAVVRPMAKDRPLDPDVTHTSVVPTLLAHWLRAGHRPPPALRCLLVGGDACPPTLALQALQAKWPIHLSYGMTETCGQVATARPDEVAADPTCVGRPLDGVKVTILRPDDQGVGTIQVSGPTVGGSHTTSDLGRLKGGQLYVVGRAMERIVSGGETVDARAIEARLAGVAGVYDVAVVGLPDPTWGQVVACAVVGDLDAARHEAARMPPAWRPRRWKQVSSLPRSDTGKLVRHGVRDHWDAPA